MREDAPCRTAATQNSIPVRVNSIALAMSASFQFRFFVGVGGGRRFFCRPRRVGLRDHGAKKWPSASTSPPLGTSFATLSRCSRDIALSVSGSDIILRCRRRRRLLPNGKNITINQTIGVLSRYFVDLGFCAAGMFLKFVGSR